MPWLLLLNFIKSKTGIYLMVGILAFGGLYSWHRSVVRAAETAAVQQTRVEVLKEQAADYEQFKKKYDEQVAELQTQIDNLTKQRMQSQIVVKAIVEKQNETNTKIDDLSGANDIINDIRSRLSSTNQ